MLTHTRKPIFDQCSQEKANEGMLAGFLLEKDFDSDRFGIWPSFPLIQKSAIFRVQVVIGTARGGSDLYSKLLSWGIKNSRAKKY